MAGVGKKNFFDIINENRGLEDNNNSYKKAAIDLFKFLEPDNYEAAIEQGIVLKIIRKGGDGSIKQQDIGEAINSWINTYEASTFRIIPTPSEKTARALIKMLFKAGPPAGSTLGSTATKLSDFDFGALEDEAKADNNILNNFFLMANREGLNTELIKIKNEASLGKYPSKENNINFINTFIEGINIELDKTSTDALINVLFNIINNYCKILQSKSENNDATTKSISNIVINNLHLIQSLAPEVQGVFKEFANKNKTVFNKELDEIFTDSNDPVRKQIEGWANRINETYERTAFTDNREPNRLTAKLFIESVNENNNSVVNVLTKPLVKKTATVETAPAIGSSIQTPLKEIQKKRIDGLINFWNNFGKDNVDKDREAKPRSGSFSEASKKAEEIRSRSGSLPGISDKESAEKIPLKKSSVTTISSGKWYESTVISFHEQVQELQSAQIKLIETEIKETEKNLTEFKRQTNLLIENYKPALDRFLGLSDDNPDVKNAQPLFENLAKKILEQQVNENLKDITEKTRKQNRQKLQKEIDEIKLKINNLSQEVRLKALILFQKDQENFYNNNIESNTDLTDKDHSFYVALYGADQLTYLLEARELAIQRQLTEALESFQNLIAEGEFVKAVKIYGDLTESLRYYIQTNREYSTVPEWNQTLNYGENPWRTKLQNTVAGYTEKLQNIQGVLTQEMKNNPLSFGSVDLDYRTLWIAENDLKTSNPDFPENNNQVILNQEEFMGVLETTQKEVRDIWNIVSNRKKDIQTRLNELNSYGVVGSESFLTQTAQDFKTVLVTDLKILSNVEGNLNNDQFNKDIQNTTNEIFDDRIIELLHIFIYQPLQKLSKYSSESATQLFSEYTNKVNIYVETINKRADNELHFVEETRQAAEKFDIQGKPVEEIEAMNQKIDTENKWITDEIKAIDNLLNYITGEGEANPTLNAEKYYDKTIILAFKKYREQLNELQNILKQQQTDKIKPQLQKAEEATKKYDLFRNDPNNFNIINNLNKEDQDLTDTRLIPLIKFYKGIVMLLEDDGLSINQRNECNDLINKATKRISIILNNVPAYDVDLSTDAEDVKKTKIWNRNEVVEVLDDLGYREGTLLADLPVELNIVRIIEYDVDVNAAINAVNKLIENFKNNETTLILVAKIQKVQDIQESILNILNTHQPPNTQTLSQAHIVKLIGLIQENIKRLGEITATEITDIESSEETPQKKLEKLRALLVAVGRYITDQFFGEVREQQMDLVKKKIEELENLLIKEAENQIVDSNFSDIISDKGTKPTSKDIIDAIARYKKLAAYVVDPAISKDKADELYNKINGGLLILKQFINDNIDKPEIRKGFYTAEYAQENHTGYIAETVFGINEFINGNKDKPEPVKQKVETAIDQLNEWQNDVLQDYDKILEALSNIKENLEEFKKLTDKGTLEAAEFAGKINQAIIELQKNPMLWAAIKVELGKLENELLQEYQLIHDQAAEKIATVNPNNDDAVEAYVQIVQDLNIQKQEYVKTNLNNLYSQYEGFIDNKDIKVRDKKGLGVQLEALGVLDPRFNKLLELLKELKEPVFIKVPVPTKYLPLKQAAAMLVKQEKIGTEEMAALEVNVKLNLMFEEQLKNIVKLAGLNNEGKIPKGCLLDLMINQIREVLNGEDGTLKKQLVDALEPILKSYDNHMTDTKSFEEQAKLGLPSVKIAGSNLQTQANSFGIHPLLWAYGINAAGNFLYNGEPSIEELNNLLANKILSKNYEAAKDAANFPGGDVTKKEQNKKDINKANKSIQRLLICYLYALNPNENKETWDNMNTEIAKENKENNNKLLNINQQPIIPLSNNNTNPGPILPYTPKSKH